MFQKPTTVETENLKSESDDRLCSESSQATLFRTITTKNEDAIGGLTSSPKQYYQNYLGNKEDIKSQHHRTRTSNFNSLNQQTPQAEFAAIQDTQPSSNNHHHHHHHHHHHITNQRSGQQMTRSTTIPHLNQAHQSSSQNPALTSSSSYQQPRPSSSSTLAATIRLPNFNSESSAALLAASSSKHPLSPSSSSSSTTTTKQRTLSTGSNATTLTFNDNPSSTSKSQSTRDQHNLDLKSSPSSTARAIPPTRQESRGGQTIDDAAVVMIKEELERSPEAFKTDAELETLSSFERNLPVELSFLIRQQAYCIARMNYLDRQVRELKETTRQATSNNNNNNDDPLQVSASHLVLNHNQQSQTTNGRTINNTHHTKNGNFILSDDSGGEYSRATISDDDELSSLLDQIAKSVRPDQRSVNPNLSNNTNSQLQQRANYTVINNQPPHPQQYAIINPNQLHHHQAVPVFVMSSPIAVAHPASSISSNVLPGVHFQPEPRYNQYYEDFYVQNNSSSSIIQRHNNNNSNSNSGIRSHQFDSSISAIEQLVSRKEKQQIKSQLKSADNWLKMRSSAGLCNINDNFNNIINGTSNSVSNNGGDGGGGGSVPAPSSSVANIAAENSNSVIEGNSRIR